MSSAGRQIGNTTGVGTMFVLLGTLALLPRTTQVVHKARYSQVHSCCCHLTKCKTEHNSGANGVRDGVIS